MHTTHFLIGGIIVSAAIPLSTGKAQSRESSGRFEVSAVVGHVTADGNDFNGTEGGTGFGGTVRYQLLGRLGLGIGIHYSDHGLQSFPEHLHIRAVYGESRYTVPLSKSAVSLLAGIRGGWVHEDITIVDWKANGWVFGGLVGVNWRLLSRFALEFQASETAIHLGDRRGADGSVIAGTSVHGSSLGLEGGLVIRF